MGTPIYYMNINGALQSFLERFLFPHFEYTEKGSCLPGTLPTGFIYTMNITKEQAEESGLLARLAVNQQFCKLILGVESKVVYGFNTVQFKDYSKYINTVFSPEEKKTYRKEHFQADLQAAYDLGLALTKK